jgi:hypothetical protein
MQGYTPFKLDDVHELERLMMHARVNESGLERDERYRCALVMAHLQEHAMVYVGRLLATVRELVDSSEGERQRTGV